MLQALETFRQQIAVFMMKGGAARVRADGCTGDHSRAPFRPKMVFRRVENCDQNLHHSLGIGSIGLARALGIWACGRRRRRRQRLLAVMATGEERPSEVADGGDDDGEVIAAIPETVVGGLVSKNLEFLPVNKEGSQDV